MMRTIDIRFNKAMINQFQRGDFTGVQPRILSVTPLPGGVLPLFGLAPRKEDEENTLVKAGV